MRAITCTGYGRPSDVLTITDIDEPTLDDDQVLVAVHAASVNPADWHLIRGNPYLARLQIGLRRPSFQVPGSDFAGVVAAIGSVVTTVRPGDLVYGTTFMAGFGAFAERVVIPERLVSARPRSASYEEAAAIPLAASTALQALRDHGKVQLGHRVLIVGASGGVGTYAVQLAKHFGATVTGVCSTQNLELLRSLGADHVIDYTTGDIAKRPERYDLVVQVAGTQTAKQLRRLLTADGTLVQLSGDSPSRWVGPLGRILAGRLGATFSRQTVTSFTVKPARDDLELLASLYDQGVLRSQLDRTYDLGEVADALEHLETGHARGKVTVAVESTSSGLARGEEGARLSWTFVGPDRHHSASRA
jgi:NADPH:quinone reductase-like Zn-dependent oxidoreductase